MNEKKEQKMQGEHKLSHQHSGVAITERDLWFGGRKMSIMIIIIIVIVFIIINKGKQDCEKQILISEITLRAGF